MRAVWYDRQGAADEVLVCGELPTPEAGHGEVRVRLEASGVNPSDTYRRRGPPAMEYPRVVTNSVIVRLRLVVVGDHQTSFFPPGRHSALN
jgi:NADPH2:quinone reductase